MNKISPLRSFQVGTLKVLVYEDSAAMGAAAAEAAAEACRPKRVPTSTSRSYLRPATLR